MTDRDKDRNAANKKIVWLLDRISALETSGRDAGNLRAELRYAFDELTAATS